MFMPVMSAGVPDNWRVAGQTVPAPMIDGGGTATKLTVLGSATDAGSSGASGQITITYTDGTTSTATLTMTDWTEGGGTWTVATGDTAVVASGYRDFYNGSRDSTTVYMFTTEIPLTAGKTMASITLPSNSSIHVFTTGAS